MLHRLSKALSNGY